MSMPMMSSATLNQRSRELPVHEPEFRYLCFDVFHVDLKREELFKGGSRLRIPCKVYQALIALMERPGEVVTREALRSRLWPDGTFVNYDANVNTTVNKLRMALGDDPDTPRYVETIPRQGYCFVGSIERTNDAAKLLAGASECRAGQNTPPAPNLSSTAVARPGFPMPSFLKSGWAAALVLCGVLLGIGIVLLSHRGS
jgi:DNA-binding winged helix-turn-helix (wHTH) protein